MTSHIGFVIVVTIRLVPAREFLLVRSCFLTCTFLLRMVKLEPKLPVWKTGTPPTELDPPLFLPLT